MTGGSANRRRRQSEGAHHAGESRWPRKQQMNPAGTTRIRFRKVSAFPDSFLTPHRSPQNEGRTEANKPSFSPNRLRKFGFTERYRSDSLTSSIRRRSWTDAWRRPSDCCNVQLPQSRSLRAADPPPASHPPAGKCRTGPTLSRLRQNLLGVRPGIDRAGKAVAGTAAAGLLLGAFGTPTDGADDLQHHVSLVRRPVDGRLGVGRHRVHQEPRSSAGGRYRAPLPGGNPGRPAGQAAAVGRAFLGGWHHDRSLLRTENWVMRSPEGARAALSRPRFWRKHGRR